MRYPFFLFSAVSAAVCGTRSGEKQKKYDLFKKILMNLS